MTIQPESLQVSIHELHARADALFRSAAFAEAAALYEEITRRVPDDSDAYLKAMKARKRAGDIQRAADVAELGLAAEALDPEALAFAENILFRTERWKGLVKLVLAEDRRAAANRQPGAQPRLIVPNRLKRGGVRDDRSPELGLYAMEAAGALLGSDLGYFEGKTILDVGCGHKQAEAIVKFGVPVKRYVGIDSYRPLMEVLAAQTGGTPLEFHHVDAHNERYSPTGEPMHGDMRLPFPDSTFDLVHAWSLFSHLNADDTQAYFHALRRCAHPDTDFFFTLFIEPGASSWRDSEEGRPLLKVRYGPDFVDGLLREAGWAVNKVFVHNPAAGPWPAHWSVHGLDGLQPPPDDVITALDERAGQSCIIARPI